MTAPPENSGGAFFLPCVVTLWHSNGVLSAASSLMLDGGWTAD
jgi:hypothetical protein